jgi:hypothetical protein
MPAYKIVFHTTKQLRKHAEYWHSCSPATTNSRSVMVNSRTTPEPEDSLDMDDFNETCALDDILASDKVYRFCFVGRAISQFVGWCVVGWVTQAITCLVQESLFQGPVSLGLNVEAKLPLIPFNYFCKFPNCYSPQRKNSTRCLQMFCRY